MRLPASALDLVQLRFDGIGWCLAVYADDGDVLRGLGSVGVRRGDGPEHM